MAGGDGGAGAGLGWRWDVALSFAGAQRDYVEQVARALQGRGLRCFYDADEQIELWGRYLAEELPAVYGEQAAAVVVFISAEYLDRDWTRLERRAALGRAVRERGSSDNGTMVGVKEPREAVLAPLAVPMSLGAAWRACNG